MSSNDASDGVETTTTTTTVATMTTTNTVATMTTTTTVTTMTTTTTVTTTTTTISEKPPRLKPSRLLSDAEPPSNEEKAEQRFQKALAKADKKRANDLAKEEKKRRVGREKRRLKKGPGSAPQGAPMAANAAPVESPPSLEVPTPAAGTTSTAQTPQNAAPQVVPVIYRPVPFYQPWQMAQPMAPPPGALHPSQSGYQNAPPLPPAPGYRRAAPQVHPQVYQYGHPVQQPQPQTHPYYRYPVQPTYPTLFYPGVPSHAR